MTFVIYWGLNLANKQLNRTDKKSRCRVSIVWLATVDRQCLPSNFCSPSLSWRRFKRRSQKTSSSADQTSPAAESSRSTNASKAAPTRQFRASLISPRARYKGLSVNPHQPDFKVTNYVMIITETSRLRPDGFELFESPLVRPHTVMPKGKIYLLAIDHSLR